MFLNCDILTKLFNFLLLIYLFINSFINSFIDSLIYSLISFILFTLINTMFQAEAWLKEQAQAMGWAKAQKVEGRSTKQGLVTSIVDERYAALVEINCETDFVARNQQFQGLAETVVNAMMKYATTLTGQSPVWRTTLDAQFLKNLPAEDGKPIADHAALLIGNVGENVSLARATLFGVAPDVQLAACTHPAPMDSSRISYGKYGALLAYKSEEGNEVLGQQLCQHIIGTRRMHNFSQVFSLKFNTETI